MKRADELAACLKGLYTPEKPGDEKSPLRYCPLVVAVLLAIMGLCLAFGLLLHTEVKPPVHTLHCETLNPSGLTYCWFGPATQEKTND